LTKAIVEWERGVAGPGLPSSSPRPALGAGAELSGPLETRPLDTFGLGLCARADCLSPPCRARSQRSLSSGQYRSDRIRPEQRRAYRAANPADWGLLQAPQVDSYQGLIFACLDESAPPLREYLGDICFYIDCALGLHPDGMEVTGEPYRFKIAGNWKSAAENNVAGDSYHPIQLHQFDDQVGLQASSSQGAYQGHEGAYDMMRPVVTNSGHTLLASPPWVPNTIWGYPEEISRAFRLDRLSAEQRRWLAEWQFVVCGVFPSFFIFRGAAKPDPRNPDTPYYPSTHIGTMHPDGAGEMEHWIWHLAWKFEPDHYKERSYRSLVLGAGTTGVYMQDDCRAWQCGFNGGQSLFARRRSMKFNLQLGLPAMTEIEELPPGEWPGPAKTVCKGGLTDGLLRNFYRRWLDLMLDEWQPAAPSDTARGAR
jgi:N,N-dimethyl phenylurea N-demethylase alpha subunit